MPSEGLEPAIPAVKRLQTYALDRAATGIGLNLHYFLLVFSSSELASFLINRPTIRSSYTSSVGARCIFIYFIVPNFCFP